MLGQFGRLVRAIANGPDPAQLPPPTEAIPTFPLSDSEPSWAYSRDVFLYMGYAVEAAGAARSQIGLHNPSGSGVVVTVTYMEGSMGGGSGALRSANDTQVAGYDNDGNEGFRDTRLRLGTRVTRPSTAKIISDDAASTGDIITRIYPDAVNPAGTTYFYHLEVPLVVFPGACLIASPNSNAVANEWSFAWEERAYDPEEIRSVKNQQF